MSTRNLGLPLKEQLDAVTASIPAPIGQRIDAGAAEIEASQVAMGLAVGDRAPDFTLPDALARPVSLTELLAAGPVVAVFYRGDWCPWCNLQLHALQQRSRASKNLAHRSWRLVRKQQTTRSHSPKSTSSPSPS